MECYLGNRAMLLQSFLKDLSVYNSMYFLFGVDPGLDQSKFQFSFKYRLFNTKGFLVEKLGIGISFGVHPTVCLGSEERIQAV